MTLRASLQGRRVHHAWIFHGPRGVGKHTTALAFGRALLDADLSLSERGELLRRDGTPIDLDAPVEHPDLHLVAKELALYSDNAQVRNRKLMNIPVEVLREHLIEPAHQHAMTELAPDRQASKVFIVDEAELIDQRTGQNILLKTLEEPPLGTVIILIASQEDRLLPTIRSRCQRVAFVPLPTAAMREWLEGRFAEVPAEERDWIEEFAAGSPGMAALAAESGFFDWWRELEPMLRELEAERLPTSLGRTLARLADEFAADWVKRHDNASKDAANKQAVHLLLSLLAQHARRRLRVNADSPDLAERWANVIDCLRDCEIKLASNVNLGLLMDHLATRMWQSLAGEAIAR
jgi:DNA polymerase III subunit delta'